MSDVTVMRDRLLTHDTANTLADDAIRRLAKLSATKSDWTNGEPRIATAEDVRFPWKFRCGFCGLPILEGEEWCFVYTNDMAGAGGNPLACQCCIAIARERSPILQIPLREVLRRRWSQQCDEWQTFTRDPKWWMFVRGLRAAIQQERG